MKPEDQARQDIDRQLLACGWIVQDRPSMNIHAGPGVAVREFPVVKPDGKRGSVDYLLYAGAKAIAVVEAKPADHSLGGVEGQAKDYAYGVDPDVPQHVLDPDARSRSVFTFHRPEELLRLVSQDQQLRHRLRHLPVLVRGKLWAVQVEAIETQERSLAANRPRALIQMATGSGTLPGRSQNSGEADPERVPAVREVLRKGLAKPTSCRPPQRKRRKSCRRAFSAPWWKSGP